MKNKALYIAGIVVLIIIGGYFFTKPETPTITPVEVTKKEVNVGAVLSLSSYGASDGESIKKGFELAKKDLLSEGYQVNIEYYDDATDPKEVVSGYQLMISKNKDVIAGPVWGYLADGIIPLVNNTKTPVLFPSLTSELVSQKANNAIYGYPKLADKKTSLIEWLKTHNIKKTAIIVNKVSWGIVHKDIFTKAANEMGATIVLSDEIGFGTEKETLPSLVLKAKSLGAEAILWSGSTDGEIIIVNELTKLKSSITLFADEEILTAVNKGQVKGGTVAIYTWEKKVSDEFRAKYKSMYNEEPSHYTDSAYDLLVYIVKGGGAKTYNGYAAQYTFDQSGDVSGLSWKTIKI